MCDVEKPSNFKKKVPSKLQRYFEGKHFEDVHVLHVHVMYAYKYKYIYMYVMYA